MDVLKNKENKESVIITLQDFPFICRICCLKQSDLRLFQEEDYLLDLFHTIRRIDVQTTAHYPKNICLECLNKLKDLSLFVDISKFNDENLRDNLVLKKEIEHLKTVESETSVTSREFLGTTEELKKDMYLHKSEMCRICLSSSRLIPFEEKAHLMQLFQRLTNIDTKPGIFAIRDNICETCIEKLEEISSFISLALFNNGKLQTVLGGNATVEPKSCSEENSINVDLSKYDLKLIENNAFFHVKKEKCEIIDIKEEVLDIKEEVINIKEEVIDIEPSTSSIQTYQNRAELHMPTQTVDNPFRCDHCYNSFTLNDDLTQHMLTHTEEKQKLQKCILTHSGEKPFKCNLCDKMFTYKQNLKTHLLACTGEKSFKCDCCEKSFNQKSYLRKHMLTHEENSFKCDCCEKSFKQKRYMRRHFLTHGENPFKCNHCENSFPLKDVLQRHLLTHFEENPSRCQDSERKFIEEDHLKHLEQHSFTHTGQSPLICNCCGKIYIYKQNLKTHSLTCTGKKSYECDFCEKSFSQKDYLHKHLVIHGKKPFKCNFCEKSFSRKDHLHNHLLNHNGKKPYKCFCCQKKFKYNQSLQRHMRTHTAENPFSCGRCEESFSCKKNLKRHLLTHTGERPFKCDYCEKSFSWSDVLKRHLFTHTQKKPFECDHCERCFIRKHSWQRHLLSHK